ncbi:MAG: glycine cleavage system protein GcvH [Planctomycetes bacterium]|nr:glycine cleavage system protein GcvH [Planctomycetota bacterium]
MKPEQLLFAETHEWAQVDRNGNDSVATIGISAFAVQQLTDLVFMQLPQVGRKLTAGEEFGEVESVKAVSPIYSPVSGTVVEVNVALPDNLDRLAADPYGAGWLIKVKIDDEAGLSKLLNFQRYQQQCEAEG